MKTSGVIMKAGKAGGDRCVYGIDAGDFMHINLLHTHQFVCTKYLQLISQSLSLCESQ